MCSIGSKSPKGAKICEVCPACTHEVRKRTECMKCPLGPKKVGMYAYL